MANVRIVRKVFFLVANVIGVLLLGRAVVELFSIDYADLSSYRLDWGGPSLAGVLAVHCGPGLAYAAGIIWWLVRRRRPRRSVAA